jgi:hypothetical protein
MLNGPLGLFRPRILRIVLQVYPELRNSTVQIEVVRLTRTDTREERRLWNGVSKVCPWQALHCLTTTQYDLSGLPSKSKAAWQLIRLKSTKVSQIEKQMKRFHCVQQTERQDHDVSRMTRRKMGFVDQPRRIASLYLLAVKPQRIHWSIMHMTLTTIDSESTKD